MFYKPHGEWLSQLKPADLERLRAVVRKVHFRYYPEHLCTNVEADRIIESQGPETAERILKRIVDGKLAG